MGLLNDYTRACQMLVSVSVPDGEGGERTSWELGETVNICMALESNPEARKAEIRDLAAVYNCLASRDAPIHYDDYFRDDTGETYRITSDPEAKKAPRSSGLPYKMFTAERKELPR